MPFTLKSIMTTVRSGVGDRTVHSRLMCLFAIANRSVASKMPLKVTYGSPSE